jgi:hypothetical protein
LISLKASSSLQGILLALPCSESVVSDDLEKMNDGPKAAIANDDMTGGANPLSSRKTAPVSDEKTFISDERRVQDALEDDEVRELLRAFHQVQEAAN